jgi:hypothetical protein
MRTGTDPAPVSSAAVRKTLDLPSDRLFDCDSNRPTPRLGTLLPQWEYDALSYASKFASISDGMETNLDWVGAFGGRRLAG